jgi:tripartite-type tricarboxylate transporter receptor subunit TctC
MAGELFMAEAAIKLVHVPYRGLGPAMSDLLGGQVQAIFATMPPAIAHVRAGRLRALAVTSAGRSEAFPDLPTIGSFLPGYEASLLNGIGAPRSTPAEVIARLNKEISAIVGEPAIKARLADLGNVPVATTPAEFGKVLAEETEKWANLIRAAHLKPA